MGSVRHRAKSDSRSSSQAPASATSGRQGTGPRARFIPSQTFPPCRREGMSRSRLQPCDRHLPSATTLGLGVQRILPQPWPVAAGAFARLRTRRFAQSASPTAGCEVRILMVFPALHFLFLRPWRRRLTSTRALTAAGGTSGGTMPSCDAGRRCDPAVLTLTPCDPGLPRGGRHGCTGRGPSQIFAPERGHPAAWRRWARAGAIRLWLERALGLTHTRRPALPAGLITKMFLSCNHDKVFVKVQAPCVARRRLRLLHS